MLTERTLRLWRKEALSFKNDIKDIQPEGQPVLELCEHILKMTQELLDQHLLRKR